jgi:four helix bundle protein
MKINSFKDLIVWQKSIVLVKEIYNLSNKLPKAEQFCLCDQMKRAAISIPSNIAEGYRRKGRQEFLQFLSISNGSAAELETQLIITQEVYSNINTSLIIDLLIEVQKMLCALIFKIKSGD